MSLKSSVSPSRLSHNLNEGSNVQDWSNSSLDISASPTFGGDIAEYFNFSPVTSSRPVPSEPAAASFTPPTPAPFDNSTDDPGQLSLLDDDGNISPVQSSSGGQGGSAGVVSKAAAAPAATLVGTAGGLQFNLIWDSSVASAPSGFQSAAITAAQLYTKMFSNAEVVNVHVGYGEVAGQSLSSNALAASMSYGYMENYATVSAALKKDASSSSWQASADASLSASDPTKGGSFFVTTAEAKALGQVSGSGTGIDGYTGLSNYYSFDFVAGTTPKAGQYDAIGAFEHEFSEVMGRMGSVGSIFGSKVYTPLDLFRYTSSGVRDLTAGPGYFSVNGGQTNLGTYNNPNNGGDAADWIPSLMGDSYGSGYSGHTAVVSPTDIIEDSVLGYKMTATAQAYTKTPGLA
jgi:hypothetical protein